MRLTQIRVESFGKLKDFTFEPKAGLNYFCKPNEFGKSTLMEFIYFIFFGYDSKRMKTYFPWDGAPLSGSISFSFEGKDWQIFRHHPQKGAEKQQLMDLTNGKEIPLATKEKPGPKLFGLDGETFLHTFYIRQGELLFKRSDGLDTALKNMAATGDENASFQQAMDFLNKEHTRYRYRTRAQGPLLELQDGLLKKSEDLAKLERALEEQIAKKQQLDQLEQKKKDLEAYLAALEPRLLQAKKNDNARRAATLAALENTAASKPRSEAEDGLLAEQAAAFEALEQAEAAVKAKKDQAEQQRRAHQNEQQRLEAFYLPAETKEKLEKLESGDKGGLIIGSLLILLAIGCGVGGNFFPPLWIGGILFGALGIFFLMRQSLACKQFCRHCGVADLKALRARWMQYEQARQQLLVLEEQEAQERQQLLAEESKLEACRSRLQEIALQTRLFSAAELKEEQFNRAVYRQSAENNRRSREQILQGQSPEELRIAALGGDPEGEGYSDVFLEKQRALGELTQLLEAMDQKELHQLADLWNKGDALHKEIAADREKEQEWKRALARVQCSIRWMEAANEEMARHFAPRLNKAAGEHLSRLTNGAYEAVQMDQEYEIRLETPFGAQAIDFFSKGTMDAVYFAFRLAVCGLISENAMPLMLDDPFVNLDEERLLQAKALLEAAAETRQIFYFTCKGAE